MLLLRRGLLSNEREIPLELRSMEQKGRYEVRGLDIKLWMVYVVGGRRSVALYLTAITSTATVKGSSIKDPDTPRDSDQ